MGRFLGTETTSRAAIGMQDGNASAARLLAERFVVRVADCAQPRTSALGLLEIAGDGIVGTALLLDGNICHVSAYGDLQYPQTVEKAP